MVLKNEIISRVYKKTGYSLKDIKNVLEAYNEVLLEIIKDEDGMRFDWFSIKVSEQKEKPFINVVTKKKGSLPATKKVSLSLSRITKRNLREYWEENKNE